MGADVAAKWFNYLTIEPGPGDGINPCWWLHHRSAAKTVKRNPYLLANEWIAGNLGAHLRLPIPPFALMRKSAATTRYFASLDYGRKESVATDMKPAPLCVHLPQIATGIVIFDVLIGNPDRHEGNAKVDDKDAPTAVELIDADHALFGNSKDKGLERLLKIEENLGFRKTSSVYDMHKIGKELTTSQYFDRWVQRAEAIPELFIEDVVEEARDLGPSAEEIDYCKDFLIRRKGKIREIIKQNKAFFSLINDWGVLWQ